VEISLERLIAPLSRLEFFSQYWGERPLVARNLPATFATLFSWEALSEILSTHRLDFPQLRLVRAGKVVAVGEYIRHQSDRRGNMFAKHDSQAVMDLLKAGAVLHITSIGEAWQPLSALSAQLELDLTARVQVNVHAGFAASRGFDTHWDGHDVFAVQIAGKKRWRLFGVTEVAPMAVPPDLKTGAPDQHTWEGVIQPGEVLYIPRGYWHAAEALDDASLHLTFAVQHPTGLDYLRSLLDNMAMCVPARRNIPIPSFDSQTDERAVQAYVEVLKGLVEDAATVQSLSKFIGEFRRSLGKTNQVRLESITERKSHAHS
jgi:ribosomal protein L16 Arg81 hydroxylase